MNKKGDNYCDSPLWAWSWGNPPLENVELSHSYCGKKWQQTSPYPHKRASKSRVSCKRQPHFPLRFERRTSRQRSHTLTTRLPLSVVPKLPFWSLEEKYSHIHRGLTNKFKLWASFVFNIFFYIHLYPLFYTGIYNWYWNVYMSEVDEKIYVRE